MSLSSLLIIIPPYLGGKQEAKNSKLKSFHAFPYGALTLASYVKKACPSARTIELFDMNFFTPDERQAELDAVLERVQPEIVGLSLMFDVSYKHVAGIARTVKARDAGAIVLMGGAAVTTSWDEILPQQPDIDALCYSEGELALRDLVNAEDPWAELQKDPWVTRQSVEQGRKPLIRQADCLDDMVDVDYTLVDVANYGMMEAFSPFRKVRSEATKQFFLVTSRGCPFKCVFCAEPSLHGKNMRYASMDVIEDHVRHLVDTYGMNVLTIYDDQLLLNHARAKDFFRRMAKYNLRIETPNGLTVAYIDEEMAYLMKQGGMDTVQLAIEHGTDYMLRQVIKKPLKLDMVAPVVESLHKNGLFVQGYFVIGIPGERPQDRTETVQFIKDVGLDWSGFSLAAPIRGSELYKICLEKKYIPGTLPIGDYEIGTYIIRAPDLDPETLPIESYRMNLDVNFINNRRMRLGEHDVAARCFEDVIERYDNHAFAYYFHAKASEHIAGAEAQAKRSMAKYREIVSTDADWMAHAKHFGLE